MRAITSRAFIIHFLLNSVYASKDLEYCKISDYLRNDEQRNDYRIGIGGIHWRNLDEDISFESFKYEDAEPTAMQKFFLTHKEINVAEFARSLGMNATLLRYYINGFKKPSAEREQTILAHIHKLGKDMLAASF